MRKGGDQWGGGAQGPQIHADVPVKLYVATEYVI